MILQGRAAEFQAALWMRDATLHAQPLYCIPSHAGLRWDFDPTSSQIFQCAIQWNMLSDHLVYTLIFWGS